MINNDVLDIITDTVNNLLKALRENRYLDLADHVDFSMCCNLRTIRQDVYEKILLSGNRSIDPYGGLAEFRDTYHRCKMQIRTLEGAAGFFLDYEITAESRPVGLIMRLKFMHSPGGMRRVLYAIQPYTLEMYELRVKTPVYMRAQGDYVKKARKRRSIANG